MNSSQRFPSSPAFRLRRFLHLHGLRLEPWASQEKILDAFFDYLSHDEHDDPYWIELTELTTQLAEDFRGRRPESALTQAVCTDVPALMAELRSALQEVRRERKSYREIKHCMSGPAMSLLLLVTLVAVGCGGDTTQDDSRREGTGAVPTVSGGAGGTGTGAASGVSGGVGGTGGSGGLGGDPIIVNPTGGTGGEAVCHPQDMTIQQMLEECVDDQEARDAYLAALAGSHPDWTPVVEEYFRCESCGDISDFIGECLWEGTRTQDDPPGQWASPWDLCVPVLVYIGVRFR